MKITFKHRLNRFFKKINLKLKSTFRKQKIRYPKKVSNNEKVASSIFLKILHEPETSLYYNPETYECYLKSDKHNLYVFLESANIKIINSKYGYDTKISIQLENYLSERFKHESSKRRNIFKQEVLSKVENSLNHTLDKINIK
jgi:hypothetical protein